jgi:hypothetical protein
VAAAGLKDGGEVVWVVDVVSGVTGESAELRAFPSEDGVVVVYRGRRDGRSVTEAVAVTASGRVSGSTLEAGAAACATDGALAWITPSKGGTSRVMSAAWGWGPATELAPFPPDRDPTIVCASRTIFALGDGERDTTATVVPGPARGASVVMRERDFTDEEREHDTYVVGDTLGLVRIGRSGTVSVREIGSDGGGPWHRSLLGLHEGDDVVAVDGDGAASMIVFTREATTASCGSSALSVHALYLSRTSPDRVVELAPATCGEDVGPFWTGAVGGAFVVGWVERATPRLPGDAPIRRLGFRRIETRELGELRYLDRPADYMVDAGCDKDHCYAVALGRTGALPRDVVPDSGDSRPQRIDTLMYP